jgi:hypothetical protein
MTVDIELRRPLAAGAERDIIRASPEANDRRVAISASRIPVRGEPTKAGQCGLRRRRAGWSHAMRGRVGSTFTVGGESRTDGRLRP